MSAGAEVVKDRVDCTGCFHVSIAWSLDSLSQEDEDGSGQATSESFKLTRDVADMEVGFDAVKVKIGNAVTSLSLASEAVEDKGILG